MRCVRVPPSQSFSRAPSGALWMPKNSKPGFNILVLNNLLYYMRLMCMFVADSLAIVFETVHN